ncbi:tetratricopeptide repeat protein [bacterium]|nr:tetratricopeptide repeat protein [bacterium]
MKKKIGLLLATVMVLNTMSSVALAEGWKSPLSNYNLYEDTHPTEAVDDERERVMDEYYQNSLGNSLNQNAPGMPEIPTGPDLMQRADNAADNVKSRNQVLRESSRNVYTDPEAVPGWTDGPSFYPEPSFDSIVEKYRRSDFAGCLQECISYVREYPNDTLGYYYMAMCYSKISDKDNAIMAYEKVIELNDNPMIVKYATNGRNCVMGLESEKCFPNVNEPELIYPYKDLAIPANLTPVDPEVLVNRNLAKLKTKLSPLEAAEKEGQNANDDKKLNITLPFGKQDAELDAFINAPYGDGFSPELKREYKQLQLRKIIDTVNTTEKAPDSEETELQEDKNLEDIQKFDDKHSDSGMIKLAYAEPSKMFEELSKDPEYIRQKQEIDELQMLFGSEKSKSDSSDMMDLLPYMSEQGDKKLSPEVIQSLMMQSMMGNLTL